MKPQVLVFEVRYLQADAAAGSVTGGDRDELDRVPLRPASAEGALYGACAQRSCGIRGGPTRGICISRAAPVRLKILAAEFDEPDLAGRPLDVAGHPLKDWVETHIPASQTVVAADGQATGYLLHRPTISMVSAEHSAARWECEDVKNQMRRFHASFVILPKASPSMDEDALLAESGFVSAALSARPLLADLPSRPRTQTFGF